MDFTIEELSMNAWPSLYTIIYDGWVIRLANGYTNRANSINPIYTSRIKLEEKIQYCDDFFSRHNLPAAYKLVGLRKDEPCDEQKALDKILTHLNYDTNDETSIRLYKLSELRSNNNDGMKIQNDFDDQWINSVINYNKITEKHVPIFKKMLGNLALEKIVVSKMIGNEIAGCGFGAIQNNYVGVFDIVVKEEFRGNGYGREIVETILSESARRGVKSSYLQVRMDNSVALHLYGKMGYREIYRYWYKKKKNEKGAVV